MDWTTLRDGITRDQDYPPRQHELLVLGRVLDGTMYDHIDQPFITERNAAGEYVPLSQRRPSVRSNLCRTVVDDAVSLLFSEGHFPAIGAEGDQVKPTEETRAVLTTFLTEAGINLVMVDAATRGAVGSVAILFRLLNSRPFLDVLATTYLTPTWRADAPDTLAQVVERYKVRGDVLAAMGYAIPEDGRAAEWWWQRIWDDRAETWFLPQSKEDASKGKAPQPDPARSTVHGLGFVPLVWTRNLPGGSGPDGAPTINGPAISTMIEIDYLLSQGGRGLKYASDPTLLIKEPAKDPTAPRVGGAAQALIVSKEGDAELLEINGTATAALLDHVRYLRALVLEAMHGNRADADRITAAQSGRAQELMHQALIWLADKLRISYGEGALMALLRMVCLASATRPVLIGSKERRNLTADGLLLHWPPWFPPTQEDRQAEATTMDTLAGARILSRKTLTTLAANSYGVDDVDGELKQIATELAAEDKRLIDQAAQIKANEPVTA